LSETCVADVDARVTHVRQRLRWMNAVSVEATPDQLVAVANLGCVTRLDLVHRFRRGPPPEPIQSVMLPHERPDTHTEIDYGPSLGQLEQIGVPTLHRRGLHGEGVLIAMLDAGFNNLAHEVFSQLVVLAHHDFVNGDPDVGDGADRGNGSHGTETLSTIGGLREGRLVGPAYAAGYLLAKTEDTTSETPVEEDNWAAAAEWAEGLGADVISSSLGYLVFDSPFTSYTFADMNGRTAISTKAAEMAAARGVVVVVSAGNAGFDPAHNTLGAPADAVRVITAGAVTPAGVRADFSSVGPTADGRIKPDVAAQGVDVIVAAPDSPHGYGLASGTSFSCPLTAGVVALLLQAHPKATVDEVIAALHDTASQAEHPDNLLGFGIVNGPGAESWLARDALR
jgi:subtilisin family serine protease